MKLIEVVAAAIIDAEKRVLIARRGAQKSLPGKWEFPGGKVEENEEHRQALERELYEEFQVHTITHEFIGSHLHHYETISINLSLYRSSYLEGEYEMSDHDRIEWVAVDQLHQYEFAPADIPLIPGLVAYLTSSDGSV